MLWSPPLLNLKVSVPPSESKTTGRLKIKLDDFLLFWIGWVTPEPVIVNIELFVAVIVTEAAEEALLVFICATVLLLSTIRSASIVTLAVSAVGMPGDQLAALDQRLSPPALLKLATRTSAAPIWPEELITGVTPPNKTLANWALVKPLAFVPKEISLLPAPVMLSVAVPQSADELSANAAEVTSASKIKFKFPAPIVIVPIADWFLLKVRDKALPFDSIFPLKTFFPLIIILWPSEVSPVVINVPALRKVESSAESTVKVVLLPFIRIPPVWLDPS